MLLLWVSGCSYVRLFVVVSSVVCFVLLILIVFHLLFVDMLCCCISLCVCVCLIAFGDTHKLQMENVCCYSMSGSPCVPKKPLYVLILSGSAAAGMCCWARGCFEKRCFWPYAKHVYGKCVFCNGFLGLHVFAAVRPARKTLVRLYTFGFCCRGDLPLAARSL